MLVLFRRNDEWTPIQLRRFAHFQSFVRGLPRPLGAFPETTQAVASACGLSIPENRGGDAALLRQRSSCSTGGDARARTRRIWQEASAMPEMGGRSSGHVIMGKRTAKRSKSFWGWRQMFAELWQQSVVATAKGDLRDRTSTSSACLTCVIRRATPCYNEMNSKMFFFF